MPMEKVIGKYTGLNKKVHKIQKCKNKCINSKKMWTNMQNVL